MWSSAASYALIEHAQEQIADSRRLGRRVRQLHIAKPERLIIATNQRISDTLILLVRLAAPCEILCSAALIRAE